MISWRTWRSLRRGGSACPVQCPSPQEVSSMDRLVSSLGREAYQEARDRAQEEMADLRSFDEQVGAIRRPDARDLIYRTLHEFAAVDGVVAQEAQILDRLARFPRPR